MFVVNKASNEQISRNQINQTKLKLKQEFSNQAFQLADLGLVWTGESELVLPSANLHLRATHINLIYALVELYREDQLELVEQDPPRFRMKC